MVCPPIPEPNPSLGPHLLAAGRTGESEVAQLGPTLCDPMDCSLPGFSIHGIFQARVPEWVAISFSRASSPTQGSNPGLPHCRQILYPLSHQGSPGSTGSTTHFPFSTSLQPKRITLSKVLLPTLGHSRPVTRWAENLGLYYLISVQDNTERLPPYRTVTGSTEAMDEMHAKVPSLSNFMAFIPQ